MRPDQESETPAPPPIVVAIDGPSGAGKSTVARALARQLGFVHLDTGAMFRAVTLHLQERGLAVAGLDDGAAAEAMDDLDLDLDAAGRVLLGGDVAGARLRSATVEAAVSAAAALPSVRARLRDLQRAFALRGSLVCEGRDMGTVVFPDAAFKFYLDASVDERARRRLADFEANGRPASIDEVRGEITARDGKDSSRELAPLVAAADAVRVDTTGLSVEEVVARLAREVRATAAAKGADA